MEFLDYGEKYEDLSLPEAVEAYQRICKNGSAYGPGIGFNLKDPRVAKYSNIDWPLYQGGGDRVRRDQTDTGLPESSAGQGGSTGDGEIFTEIR